MSQKSSRPQPPKSVSQALIPDRHVSRATMPAFAGSLNGSHAQLAHGFERHRRTIELHGKTLQRRRCYVPLFDCLTSTPMEQIRAIA